MWGSVKWRNKSLIIDCLFKECSINSKTKMTIEKFIILSLSLQDHLPNSKNGSNFEELKLMKKNQPI